MGVVSLLQENQRSSTKLAELRRTGRVSVLFEEDGDDSIPQQEDIYRLVNFLAVLRFRAVVRDGRIGINMNLLKRP
jgi:hypothetical protein